jgi:hypothetical protein
VHFFQGPKHLLSLYCSSNLVIVLKFSSFDIDIVNYIYNNIHIRNISTIYKYITIIPQILNLEFFSNCLLEENVEYVENVNFVRKNINVESR